MATPITFAPFIGWVDATDPNNIPADVRIIGAADLLRYESFCRDAAAKINSTESTVESHTASLATQNASINSHTTSIGTLNTSMGTAQTDITNLKKLLVPTVTKTSSYTTTAADNIIIGNGTSITITLLSAVTAGNGKVFRIKNKAATALTVASAAGTIDGATTKSLAQWASLAVVSDGANWFVI